MFFYEINGISYFVVIIVVFVLWFTEFLLLLVFPRCPMA